MTLMKRVALGLGVAAAAGAGFVTYQYSDTLNLKAFDWKSLQSDLKQTFADPSQPVLLPPPIGEAYGYKPYTLVLELNGVLTKPEWTYKTGWRFKKRPNIDYFLKQCGPPTFEIVIYTQDQGSTAFPIIDALDPLGYISYRLFKDSTKYINGTYVKELNQLGRKMERVIHIDWNAEACQTSPENCFLLKKWDGNSDDRTLLELSDFLSEIAKHQVDDVRPILRHYAQFDDPLNKFKENIRKLDAVKSEQSQKQQASSPNVKVPKLEQAPKML